MTLLPQNMTALQKANKIRLARSALHREIAALSPMNGRNRLAELLLDIPDWLETQHVYPFLMWSRRLGASQARTTLTRLHISQTRPLGSLTDRQARELADDLRAPGELGSRRHQYAREDAA